MTRLSEDDMLERIRARFRTSGTPVGPGDDAAVLDPPGCRVASTDVLVEGIDFTGAIPARFVGWKSLAANLSDIAAMGARTRAFLLTLGLADGAEATLDDLVGGMADLADEEGIALAGGDLSSSPTTFISITTLGDLAADSPLERSGARPGDRIYVSRPLGGSAAGLALLRQGWVLRPDGSVVPPESIAERASFPLRELAGSAVRQHAMPTAETTLGPMLAERNLATACIDVSDGLSTDLARLCRASGCGAIIEFLRIPPFPDLPEHAVALGLDARSVVLHGGEEYALLFTSSKRESELSGMLGRPVYAIGRIVAGEGIVLETDDGSARLEPAGFDHFAR